MSAKDVIITKKEFENMFNSIEAAKQDRATYNSIVIPYFANIEHYIKTTMIEMAKHNYGDIVLTEPGKEDIRVKSNLI